MKRIIILSLAVVFGGLNLLSQNSIDALRYSRLDYSGTARFNAMGGSFGALGGEISAITINPAAVGVYRNSEFTFSTGFVDYGSETNFRGNLSTDNKFNFNIPNIGYVGSYRGNPNGWKNYSFSIQYNRTNNFNKASRLVGNSQDGSIVNDYVNILNNNSANPNDVTDYTYPFGASEAWNTFLIDTISQNGVLEYVPWFFFQDNIEQKRRRESSGSQSETTFSFGGNYQDRLYLGASINFQRINFEQTTYIDEKYTYDPPPQIDEFLVTDYQEISTLRTRGTGVNFKLGAIYRVTDAIRVGASVHSPTFFGLNEEFTLESNSRFSNGETFDSGETITNFGYRLRTPTRYSASLAYLFKQKGAMNIDYEYVDYSGAMLNSRRNDQFDFSNGNNDINDILTGAHNIRVGGEYNFLPFVVRAGYRYEGNPFDSNLTFNPDGSRSTYSIGGGLKSKNCNFDVAYFFSAMDLVDPFHQTADAPVNVSESFHSLIMTIGWRW